MFSPVAMMFKSLYYFSGEVKVKWTTACEGDSPYANLSGTETFEDGDGVSHIKIDLPEIPQDKSTEQFSIVLSPPKADNCKLGQISERAIEINNDIGKFLTEK